MVAMMPRSVTDENDILPGRGRRPLQAGLAGFDHLKDAAETG
jgi:hypothetical protein